jgi:hypothetical protein
MDKSWGGFLVAEGALDEFQLAGGELA